MIGNQAIINRMIEEHENNVLPEKICNIKRIDVLQIISDEYWKEWRRLMRYGETPTIYCKELGKFRIRYSQLRSYLFELLKSIRYKLEYKKEELLDPNGMFATIYATDEKKFRAAWKQADVYKKWMNDKNLKWKNKKIKLYGDKAIL